MSDWFSKFSRKTKSANEAKERLKLVLIHDRTDISATTLAEMKDESLILKGDTNIPYGKIVKIMDIVKKSGVKKLIIATRQGTSGKKVP